MDWSPADFYSDLVLKCISPTRNGNSLGEVSFSYSFRFSEIETFQVIYLLDVVVQGAFVQS